MGDNEPVRILGLGGSGRPGSSSERALRIALARAADLGAETDLLVGPDLNLPLYQYGALDASGSRLVAKVKWAEGIIVSSPGYHGAPSGMIKNAFDYIEELRTHDRPYFDGMAVGCIAVADGWQAAVTTLQGLRTIVHALRGWPTPLGVSINNAARQGGMFAADGTCHDTGVQRQLETVAQMVVGFARAVR